MSALSDRCDDFCRRFGLRVPILLAPMAGACPPSLSIAVGEAGGMGGCGALPFSPQEMRAWAESVRAASAAPFQINLWVPEPPPSRNPEHEARVRQFLAQWGPPVPESAADEVPRNFTAQSEALLSLRPAVASSIMGVLPADLVTALKAAGIAWYAVVTTVKEAILAEKAGADVIVAQGMEAGGHRGSFDNAAAERQQVGLFALLPQVVDAVRLPVVATGGIADPRGIAAALLLGASAVQIGTAFLRCREAHLPQAWSDALAKARPEDTTLTRAFSGRAGRALLTDYVRAAAGPNAPSPAPYPVQRGLTAPMRRQAIEQGTVQTMQAWAGQAASLARPESATQVIPRLWREAQDLLRA
ncbi:MAG: nitronate monooxygenase [Steroidobacteraceae bacterium]